MLRFLPDPERVRYRQLEQQAQEIRHNYAGLNEHLAPCWSTTWRASSASC